MTTPADMQTQERWPEFWKEVLAQFEAEAGDEPESEELADWELDLLARVFGETLASTSSSAPSKRGPPSKNPLGVVARRTLLRLTNSPASRPSLSECEKQLKMLSARHCASQEADRLLKEAAARERSGQAAKAQQAYEKALSLGPANAVEARLRFAQLLRCFGSSCIQESEAELRRAIGTLPVTGGEAGGSKPSKPPAKTKQAATAFQKEGAQRQVLQRLIMLLCQEGREAEAKSLLLLGGWTHRLAPCVLRYPLASEDQYMDLVHPVSAPAQILDDSLPEPILNHLLDIFGPSRPFWQEHGYNEVVGSGENGYFSYLHELQKPPTVTLDKIIAKIFKIAQRRFPKLVGAKYAEWWAHCRPHPVGHQLHYDSDNEGIGGARHPICSCVVYVDAPGGLGGPTLMTDQRLGDSSLATHGWLAHPKTGRLVVFDGTVLHGVIPGRGMPPAAAASDARRVTWMVAFWPEISLRPFGEDGLAGSSRPLPDTSKDFTAGSRTYTWHKALALANASKALLDAVDGDEGMSSEVKPRALPAVWARSEDVNASEMSNGERSDDKLAIPPYNECFQW
eukprot:TRINITY_DN68764_c0_g1_i1.p1 TRINITY_DN68764_c0_g1~~TRINITY_DN68764_c0_g1_i1.p1  ORF type:complete len:567 (+),score=75.09 TRINITY_DN68764_c0_g1_i1:65-1765(+)